MKSAAGVGFPTALSRAATEDQSNKSEEKLMWTHATPQAQPIAGMIKWPKAALPSTDKDGNLILDFGQKYAWDHCVTIPFELLANIVDKQRGRS